MEAEMSDPSFILKGTAARDLKELARHLQALVDTRNAAIEQPLSVPDIDFSQFEIPAVPAA
jgi:hypothetical protein